MTNHELREPQIPAEVAAWMEHNHWGTHHAVWHWSRLWEQMPSMNDWIRNHGGGRAGRQEGTPGNGLDFLAMHRVMIRALEHEFPVYHALWAGWDEVPKDADHPADPEDRMPGNGLLREFPERAAQALARLRTLEGFASDDELGLYIQSSLRPIAANPSNRSSDPTAGVHNQLHRRFAVRYDHPDAGISLNNFYGCIKNKRFWKLHGYLDRIWTAYRAKHRLSETEPAYVRALAEQAEHMMVHVPQHRRAAAAAAR